MCVKCLFLVRFMPIICYCLTDKLIQKKQLIKNFIKIISASVFIDLIKLHIS